MCHSPDGSNSEAFQDAPSGCYSRRLPSVCDPLSLIARCSNVCPFCISSSGHDPFRYTLLPIVSSTDFRPLVPGLISPPILVVLVYKPMWSLVCVTSQIITLGQTLPSLPASLPPSRSLVQPARKDILSGPVSETFGKLPISPRSQRPNSLRGSARSTWKREYHEMGN